MALQVCSTGSTCAYRNCKEPATEEIRVGRNIMASLQKKNISKSESTKYDISRDYAYAIPLCITHYDAIKLTHSAL